MCAQYTPYAGAELGGGLVSPRRRGHPGQPPSLLTTSLNNNAQHLGLGHGLNSHTPVSTTSLSSPFSAAQAQYSPSPGGASRGNSPMALRSATGFSAPYNPQQWGRPGHESMSSIGAMSTATSLHSRQSSTRTTTFAPRLQGPDGIVSSTLFVGKLLTLIFQSLLLLHLHHILHSETRTSLPMPILLRHHQIPCLRTLITPRETHRSALQVLRPLCLQAW